MTTVEVESKTDYPQEVRRILRPVLMTLALTALLVVILGVSVTWPSRHSWIIAGALVPAILGLLAFGAYRGWAAAQELVELFVGQISVRQEQLDALRRRHFLLSAAMSGIGDAVIAADAGGRITFLNPVAEALTGWQEWDALGHEVKTVLMLEEGQNEAAQTETALADFASAILVASVRLDFPTLTMQIARTGERRPIAGSGAPIWEEHGKPGGVALVFRDISEQREAAESLQEMKAQRVSTEARTEALHLQDMSERLEAEEALRRTQETALAESRDRSALLANMSDELRTPLNAVIGYSEMLQEEAQDRQGTNFVPDLQKIHEAGKHLLSLINDILDLSKIEAGQMELFPEIFEIAPMLEEVTKIVHPIIVKNENTLQVSAANDLGVMRADRLKVKQSLLNLLSNAAGYSHGRTVTLDVSRERDEAGGWVIFRLADTSANQSVALHQQLLKTASSPETSDLPRFSGHGLALVIARLFCQMQGGEFTGSREPGHGAVYRLRYPAQ